jgi:nitrous oxidase accessory protein NosD
MRFLYLCGLVLVGCTSETISNVDGTSVADITTCTTATPGLTITKSTRLCGGVHASSIAIAGDDITLTCEPGAMLDGAGSNDVGIRVDGGHRIRVDGCAARGFRYGLVANGTQELTLSHVHFDDNFRDESQEWVQDGVQGGGIRLENVEDAVVESSTFARNWNGIELRLTKRVQVRSSDGSHASNWGAFVDHSEDAEISDSNFDWGIRWGRARPVAEIPLEQRDRTNWFGQDTKDSGGIVVDGGSEGTRILRNSVRYGGDGIFVRAITGRCPHGTYVEGNDVSFSPHFALETWCDGDTYVNNTSTDSDNGIWFGGGSNIVARGNRIERSRVFALSIMENQGRHITIEDNTFAQNRAGIMVTGRNRWPGQPMDSASWPNMANSSHIVIQRNHFDGNELANIAASFTRSLTVASNCDGTSDVEPALGPETQGVRVLGHCGAVTKPPPSDVRLDVKPVVNAGAEAQLSASARGASSFSWLVQPANHRFPSGQLPPALLSATSEEPSASVVLGVPGLFDVDITADNGELASIAHTQIAVPPNGIRIGESPTDWTSGGAPPTAVDGLDGPAVRLETTVATAHARGEPIAAESKIAFFLRAENPKPWQRGFTVRVTGPDGTASFIDQILDPQRAAAGNILKFGERDWIYVQIPLKGGDGFTRTGTLPSTIDTIAIESETTPGDPLALIVDDLTLF